MLVNRSLGGEGPGAVEHGRRQVDARHMACHAREGAGQDAWPAGHVEHRVVRTGSTELHDQPQGLLVLDGGEVENGTACRVN